MAMAKQAGSVDHSWKRGPWEPLSDQCWPPREAPSSRSHNPSILHTSIVEIMMLAAVLLKLLSWASHSQNQ